MLTQMAAQLEDIPAVASAVTLQIPAVDAYSEGAFIRILTFPR